MIVYVINKASAKRKIVKEEREGNEIMKEMRCDTLALNNNKGRSSILYHYSTQTHLVV